MDIDLNWVSQNPIIKGTATPSSGQFSQLYTRCYTMINRANDVIANINSVPDMKDADKAKYIAEYLTYSLSCCFVVLGLTIALIFFLKEYRLS